VGSDGGKLSGGEQQRIAIARAMLKNPEYLILDEATANLDPVTAQKIRAGVLALAQGRTAILVAHDYRMVAGAQHVIVMRGGAVEDEGTVEELKERNAFFRAFAGE
jgi:ATP-binding cassette subfamily B protein AbcA/BmrA